MLGERDNNGEVAPLTSPLADLHRMSTEQSASHADADLAAVLAPVLAPHPFTLPLASQHPPPILTLLAANHTVVDVWSSNLQQEFARLIQLVDEFPFVGFDACFPGVLFRPVLSAVSKHDYHYATIKANVDLLTPLTFAITLCDYNGNPVPVGHSALQSLPQPSPQNFHFVSQSSLSAETSSQPQSLTHYHSWHFHFRFSFALDYYAEDSLMHLITTRQLNLSRHESDGIDVSHFAELLMTSGLILNPSVYWLSRDSAYDFSFLLKLCLNSSLPDNYQLFLEMLALYFPNILDSQSIANSSANIDSAHVDGNTVQHSLQALQRFFRARLTNELSQDALLAKNRILYGLQD